MQCCLKKFSMITIALPNQPNPYEGETFSDDMHASLIAHFMSEKRLCPNPVAIDDVNEIKVSRSTFQIPICEFILRQCLEKCEMSHTSSRLDDPVPDCYLAQEESFGN